VGDKKGGFVSLFLSFSLFFSLFLSFSFVYFAMVHKKRTCRLSAKIGTDSSRYGKIDTF
jgi:hypothetical protein